MITYELGAWPYKRFVDISGNQLTIRNKKKILTALNIDQIQNVYQSYPDGNSAGSLFFSLNGEKPPELIELSDKNIFYSSAQQRDVQNILSCFDTKIILITGECLNEYKEQKLDNTKQQAVLLEQKNINQSKVSCPNCNSINIEHLRNNTKSFSVGKAIAGGLLTGGIGTLAGFAGKKGKTDKWHCKNCGNVFDK